MSVKNKTSDEFSWPTPAYEASSYSDSYNRIQKIQLIIETCIICHKKRYTLEISRPEHVIHACLPCAQQNPALTKEETSKTSGFFSRFCNRPKSKL